VFLRLDKKYQDVIADICKRMGAGMAEFVTAEAAESEVSGCVLVCVYVGVCVWWWWWKGGGGGGLSGPTCGMGDAARLAGWLAGWGQAEWQGSGTTG
jgi:hypothetical protein